jgi:tetratricopeptide (TPR) repeat protein
MAMPSVFPAFQWLALVVCCILCVGCSKKSDPDTDSAGPAPPIAKADGPPTEEECQAFGRKLEKAVAEGDKAATDQLFHIKDLMERADRELKLDLTPADQDGLKKVGERTSGRTASEAIGVAQNGGSYTFLRVHTVDGKRRVLMRTITPDGGLTYHDILLIRYPDGQVATHDLYDFAKGAMLTDLFGRGTLALIAQLHPDMFARLSPSDQLYAKHENALVAMDRDIRSGRAKEALATFRALPAELQMDKLFQLVAVQAAQRTNDDDYLLELERLRRNHPGNVVTDLWSVEYYIFKKQCKEALECIDRLDKMVGGDPFLDVKRADALIDAGRHKEAREAAEKAVKNEPKLRPAYWVLATVAVEEKNYSDTSAWLKKLVEATGETLTAAELEQDERFTAFAKTPQFKELKRWLDERGK